MSGERTSGGIMKNTECTKGMDTQHDDKPYERFIRYGPDTLTDAELLAIIIRTGTHEDDSTEISKKILALKKHPGGLLGLHYLTVQDLLEVRGIGMVKAVRIKCISELVKRMSKSKALQNLKMDKPSTVADYFMEELRHMQTECILLLMLDNKNRLLSSEIVSKGTVNTSLLSPREVMITALHNHAVSIILLHNHPSGDPSPSQQDVLVTLKVNEASQLIGIPLLDHIIIGDNRYISLKEQNLFQTK